MAVSLQENTKNYLCHKIILNKQENFITWRSKQVKKKYKLLMTKLEKIEPRNRFVFISDSNVCSQRQLCSKVALLPCKRSYSQQLRNMLIFGKSEL